MSANLFQLVHCTKKSQSLRKRQKKNSSKNVKNISSARNDIQINQYQDDCAYENVELPTFGNWKKSLKPKSSNLRLYQERVFQGKKDKENNRYSTINNQQKNLTSFGKNNRIRMKQSKDFDNLQFEEEKNIYYFQHSKQNKKFSTLNTKPSKKQKFIEFYLAQKTKYEDVLKTHKIQEKVDDSQFEQFILLL